MRIVTAPDRWEEAAGRAQAVAHESMYRRTVGLPPRHGHAIRSQARRNSDRTGWYGACSTRWHGFRPSRDPSIGLRLQRGEAMSDLWHQGNASISDSAAGEARVAGSLHHGCTSTARRQGRLWRESRRNMTPPEWPRRATSIGHCCVMASAQSPGSTQA